MDKNNQGTKECPMCAESVKEKAKICRFCRYEFELTINKKPFEEDVLVDEMVEEDLVEDTISDDKGWEAYDNFISTDSSPDVTEFEARYDVWITSTYNDKVCNEIIKITKWDSWVAGKFLLELENYGDARKLVEMVSLDEAEKIKNMLEHTGAKIRIEYKI